MGGFCLVNPTQRSLTDRTHPRRVGGRSLGHVYGRERRSVWRRRLNPEPRLRPREGGRKVSLKG